MTREERSGRKSEVSWQVAREKRREKKERPDRTILSPVNNPSLLCSVFPCLIIIIKGLFNTSSTLAGRPILVSATFDGVFKGSWIDGCFVIVIGSFSVCIDALMFVLKTFSFALELVLISTPLFRLLLLLLLLSIFLSLYVLILTLKLLLLSLLLLLLILMT